MKKNQLQLELAPFKGHIVKDNVVYKKPGNQMVTTRQIKEKEIEPLIDETREKEVNELKEEVKEK